MKAVMLRVGVDSGAGGTQGPLFEDDTFEFIPIPKYNSGDRTYGEILGKYNKRPLNEYLPNPEKMKNQSMHFDPEFETFTYGDPTQGGKRGLRKLEKGDKLIFYAGLEGWGDFHSDPALYLIGYFEVEKAGIASSFDPLIIRNLFANNAHVRNQELFDAQNDKLILIKGSKEKSRLLEKAVKISTMGEDKAGKPLKVLSREMKDIFGPFFSIQRSSPRWIKPDLVDTAMNHMRRLP